MENKLSSDPIRHFTTRDVPLSMRFDCWMDAISKSIYPVSDWNVAASVGFEVQLREAPLGCLSSIMQTISAHEARRTRADVERSSERSYHLFVSRRAPWAITHDGRHERLEAGDVVLVGPGEQYNSVPFGFDGIVIKCPEAWLKTWLRDPGVLVGHAFRRDERWGRVLSPMLLQLSPEFAAAPPLPHAVMVDQVGAVLALVANDGEVRHGQGLVKKIRACIRDRCGEPQLALVDVAACLACDPPALHRALAASNTTFAAELLNMRVAISIDMLSSASHARFTVAEISRLAGFTDITQFARLMKRRTGLSPRQHRCSA